MQVFVIKNNVGMMKNVDLNVKSLLITEDLVKDLFGIPAIRNVNAINHVMLENI